MGVSFERERLRHDLVTRTVRVVAVNTVAPPLVRVTVAGPDLAGFDAPGPADHVKLFFPDPLTGVLTAPTVTAHKVSRPERGQLISRDYTPVGVRADGPHGPELDLDFVLHGDQGPASVWASGAQPGDQIVVAGPRGSLLPPRGAGSAVIVADETALPAAARWLDSFSDKPVTGLFFVSDERASGYLPGTAHSTLRWFSGPDRAQQVEHGLRDLSFDSDTFVFLAGEAGVIARLRRYLRTEVGLAKERVDAHGYWKQGVSNLDHHAPLDPSDPD